MLEPLSNVIQPYAWGSRTALAELRGASSPTPTPEAELWMGTHPLAPSKLLSSGRTLLSAIEADPVRLLGEKVLAEYGPRLPFLLKVLAAAAPLSLQAHPSLVQASRGFALEEARKIPRDAAERSYKDDNHKPELLCALGEFWALCGFRPVRRSLALLEQLGVPELAARLELLRRSPDASGLKALFSSLMLAPEAERRTLAQRTLDACRAESGGEFSSELAWGARIGALYPGDVGIVSALLLNLLKLEPAQAIYLPAGNLHAYLDGTGVELMASSDNVLRGGLTPKHVNVSELLQVLDFGELVATPIAPEARAAESVYRTPAREFELSSLRPEREPRGVRVDGPEIWLVTSGELELSSPDATIRLEQGGSAFVSADTGQLALAGGGLAFRARVA